MSVYSAMLFGVALRVAGANLAKQASGIDSFKQCLISSPTSFGYCLGMGALGKLQSIDSNPEFDLVDGVTFAMDEQQVRESYNFLDRDPGDFRTIVDSLGQVFSRRSLRWDMSMIYPGLAMRVAPSGSPGGILEFILDPHREVLSAHSLKEASTGRLIARQFLVPLLLGFKFNVATLIPIVFGLLAVVAKKFLLLSKLGLIISSAIGLGSLLFGTKYPQQQQGSFNPGFGGNYGYGTYNRFQHEDPYYDDSLYRENSGYADETTNVRGGGVNEIQQPYVREDASGRNFAWNEAEKKTKT